MKTQVVYTRRIAYQLRKMGFKIIKVVPNEYQPQYDNYIFEDTAELQEALAKLK